MFGFVQFGGRKARASCRSLIKKRRLAYELLEGRHVLAPVFLAPENYDITGLPHDTAKGDFNADGRLDLAIANDTGGSVSIMLGQATGGFSAPTTYTTGTRALCVATADFDEDGDLDLVVCNYGDNNVSVLLGNGNGTFGAASNYNVGSGSGPHFVAIADFDGDGKLDLGSANYGSDQLSILKGNGDGNFSLTGAAYYSGVDPVIVIKDDWNGDQKIDLAIVNGGGDSVSIFFGRGDGSFEPRFVLNVGSNPYAIASCDLNHDNRHDLVVTNRVSSSVSVFLGNGDGTFQPQQTYFAGYGATSVAVDDFDFDGNLDLVVASIWTPNLYLLMGKGDGSFQPAITIPVAGAQRSVITGDFNGDQKPDIATSIYYNDKFSILYNATVAAPDLAVGTVSGQNIFVLQNADVASATASVALSNSNPAVGTVNGFSTSQPYLLTATTGQTINGAGPITPGSVIRLLSTASTTTSLGATVTYTTTAADSNPANNTATVNVRVGNAPLDATNSSTNFGPGLVAATPISGTPYTNLSSNTIGQVSTGTAVPTIGTTATILDYTNSTGSDTGVSMAWRSRTSAEADVDNSPHVLLSDVVRISGMETTSAGSDVYLLTMSYDLDQPNLGGPAENSLEFYTGSWRLLWFNGSNWVNAIDGNNGGSMPSSRIFGAPSGGLGSWGIDISAPGGKGVVWAYLNHGGDFAFGHYVLPPTNTPPTVVAAPDPIVVNVGATSRSVALTPIFTDAEDGATGLTYRVVGNTSNAIVTVDSSYRELRLNFDYAVPGTGVITIRATDTQGLSVDTTLPVTINALAMPRLSFADSEIKALEDAPLTTIPGIFYNYRSGIYPTVNISTDHPEYFEVQPSISFDPVTNIPFLSFRPAADAFGLATVSYALDNDPVPQQFQISIAPVNDAPVFQAGPNVEVEQASGAYNHAWVASASPGPSNESSQSLDYFVTTDRPDLFAVTPAISPTGQLTFTPASNSAGLARVTVVARDNGGIQDGGVNESLPQAFTITVDEISLPSNTAPTTTGIADRLLRTFQLGSTVFPKFIELPLWNAFLDDTGSQNLTYDIQSDTATPSGFTLAFNSATGVLRAYLPAGGLGTTRVTVTAYDSLQQSATTSFNLEAKPVEPEFVSGGNVLVAEDSGRFSANWGNYQNATPTSNPFFQLTADHPEFFSVQPALVPGATLADPWTLSFTPAANVFGTTTITVQERDYYSNVGQAFTFEITIQPVNDAPSFSAIDNLTVLEDAGALDELWATDIKAGPDNESSQQLNWSVIAEDPALFLVQPYIDDNGRLHFTPAADANGTTQLTVQLKDHGGTDRGGIDTTRTTLSLTIEPVNDAPSFQAVDNITVREDSGAYNELWATYIKAGPDDESSQQLTWSVVADDPSLFLEQPRIDHEGRLHFTPAANANGITQLTVLLKDDGGSARGGIDTTRTTLTLTIDPVDDRPTFTAGPNIVWQRTAGAFSSLWATAISSGADNEADALEFVVEFVDPAHASLFLHGPEISPAGILTFTPNAVALGTAKLRVTLRQKTIQTSDLRAAGSQSTLTPTSESGEDFSELFEITLTDRGPQILSIEYVTDNTKITAPFETAISAVVLTFDRFMSESGSGSVLEKLNWSLMKDGIPISEKIGTLERISADGEATRLRINFTEALGTGSYVLTAAATITDHQGLALNQTNGEQSGSENTFSFSISIYIPPKIIEEPPDKTKTIEKETTTSLELPKVLLAVTAPVIQQSRIQATQKIEQEVDVPPSTLDAPITASPEFILENFNSAVAQQPEIAITALGTTFVTNTFPDLALDEDGDDFLTREEVKKRLSFVQRPVISETELPKTAFPWWWVGLGLSSLLGGIGYYTLQRRLAARKNSPQNNNQRPELAETELLPVNPE